MLPGSMLEMRDPTAQEVAEQADAAIAMECPAGSVAMWDGRVCEYPHAAAPLRVGRKQCRKVGLRGAGHGSFARKTEGERVVLHATYCRLLMRPQEAYSDEVAESLVAKWGTGMSTLLGREDYLQKVDFGMGMSDAAAGLEAFSRTMANARS